MNLVFIGAGFVGLVSAAVFADFKNKVWVIDNDQKKINDLERQMKQVYNQTQRLF